MLKVLMLFFSALAVVSAQSCVDLEKVQAEFEGIEEKCVNHSRQNESNYDDAFYNKFIECVLNERKMLDDGPLSWEKLSKEMQGFIPANTPEAIKEDLLKKIKEVWEQHSENLKKFFEEMWKIVMQACPDDFLRFRADSENSTSSSAGL